MAAQPPVKVEAEPIGGVGDGRAALGRRRGNGNLGGDAGRLRRRLGGRCAHPGGHVLKAGDHLGDAGPPLGQFLEPRLEVGLLLGVLAAGGLGPEGLLLGGQLVQDRPHGVHLGRDLLEDGLALGRRGRLRLQPLGLLGRRLRLQALGNVLLLLGRADDGLAVVRAGGPRGAQPQKDQARRGRRGGPGGNAALPRLDHADAPFPCAGTLAH